MSRLIVKNLPPTLTPVELRAHFSSADGPGGEITDLKVARKPDGTSRRFGFVGFRTEEQAQRARKWYDRTFIGSSRIAVAVVEGVKDAPPPRPNKRPRLGPSPDEAETSKSPNTKRSNTQVAKSETQTSKAKGKDVQLNEFMRVMQPRARKGPSWKDDDVLAPVAVTESAKKLSSRQERARSESANEDGDDTSGDKVDENGEQTAVSDMDWLKRHTKSSLDISDPAVEEKVYEQSDDEMDVELTQQNAEDARAETTPNDTMEAILKTGRLFLRNLLFSCTEDELLDLFKPFGEVAQVHIPLNSITKAAKGLAFVTFPDPSNAVAAYKALDKRSFQGRLLHIIPAVDRKGNVAVEEGAGRKKTVKEDREAKRKVMAGREFNWSMLYMNSDAVLSSVADRMSISKADILNPESDNAAVKLALAETHVIQETKDFLETNGVVLSALAATGGRVARSDTTILIKNIPYGTSAEQIRELFEPHGKLSRVLVPPASTMAVVEFAHADEGRRAFKAVAYRRMRNSIIYLEKGPVGMFLPTDETTLKTAPVTVVGAKPITIQDAEAEAQVAAVEAGAGMEDAPALNAGTTLFVKNLSFSTTSERFTQAFRHLPGFAFARVQIKSDPKRPNVEGARLSMGYGFIGFRTAEAARKALKSLQGYALDGHALVVKFAGRGKEEEEKGAADGKSVKSRTTKMIVKNVPFEATKKDIRELFGAHGQLKSVRLPKKFDHRSRGFAFLDFVTRQEAENAYNTLRHTHLLGRHLVLEWAEEDSSVDIDELRRKAGIGLGGGKELPGRKRKLDMGDSTSADAGEEIE